jgi:hypothetical protein
MSTPFSFNSVCFVVRYFLLLILFGSVDLEEDIHLSPTSPIATLQAARDAARSPTIPVRIIVSDGVYSITEALTLGDEDGKLRQALSPCSVEAYGLALGC